MSLVISTCAGCRDGWPVHTDSEGKPCHYEPGRGNGPTEHFPCTDPYRKCRKCGETLRPGYANNLCPACAGGFRKDVEAFHAGTGDAPGPQREEPTP